MIDKNDYIRYSFLLIGVIIFLTLVIKDLFLALYLKTKGKKAFGKIVSIKTLQGRSRLGADNKSLIIAVKTEDLEFTFESLNTNLPSHSGKIPILYIKKNNSKIVASADSWEVLLTDAILFSTISIAFVFIFFLIKK